ncbi:hypothetical protein BT69DRAFT_1315373 [Atractiella rhizophila]|nr:hypothetical protein BT69DRAFT_1315373 [Atractiella rhizophila]
MPGNHDLGLYTSIEPYSRDRFRANFGEINWEIVLGNHSIVAIDSMGILEERRYKGSSRLKDWTPPPGGAIDFINKVARRHSDLPRILLSHIPLFRPEGTTCGPLREHPRPIYQGRGLNYQNLMDEEVTNYIIDTLQPAAIYSGDDHDHCQIVHQTRDLAIPETSLKSFSMVMGIKRPGFLLLTLATPLPSAPSTSLEGGGVSKAPSTFHPPQTHGETLCLLPDQIRIFTHQYLFFLLFTIISIVWIRQKYNNASKRSARALANGLPIYGTKHRKGLSRSLLGRRRGEFSSTDGDVEDLDPLDDPLTYPSSVSSPIISSFDGYSYHSPIEPSDDFYGTTYEAHSRTHSRRQSRVFQNFDPPTQALLARILDKLPVLRSVIYFFAGRTSNGRGKRVKGVFEESIGDFLSVTWPAAILYVLIWNWFAY